MASRARLSAPPPAQPLKWPWHKADCGVVTASVLSSKDRRLEAQTYLSTGYGIRVAIERQRGWKPLGKLARVWMPGRLKGIQVSRENGTPFLAATQVYDVRPIPRKWLALERTSDAANRFVSQGTIFVTCSGSVGRPCMAYAVHENTLISHDLLRVAPIDDAAKGWIYAYLHSRQAQAMAVGSHYGHIIKHLEPSHLEALPVPPVDGQTAGRFATMFNRMKSLRNESYRLTCQAESEFAAALSAVDVRDWGENGFTVRASQAFLGGRLRLDAVPHNPGAASIRRHLERHGKGFTNLGKSGYDIWLPSRFRRIPAADGVWLLDSADLTEVNPVLSKRIADGDFGDAHKGRVKAGWVLMARSGQTYGIIGTPFLATADLEGHVISDHVMRIAPMEKPAISPGYLVTALGHPTLGRPLIKALAYVSSIPEIEVSDMADYDVVRLAPDVEEKIAGLAQQAADSKASADVLERDMTCQASEIIEEFVAGKRPRGRQRDAQEIARGIVDIVTPDA